MFGKKKSPKTIPEEFKRIQEMLDETIEQKKNTLSSARNLTKKLTDTLPPMPARKAKTA